MITRLVLFGATGDLAGRFLLPALARAIEAGALPSELAVVGAAPQDWDDETFAAHVADRLVAYAGNISGEVRDVIQNHLLQILALVAMEPPPSTSATDLHQVRLDVLRSVRLAVPGPAAQTSRARYTAGTPAGGSATVVPDYAGESAVPGELVAYGQVLADILSDGNRLSVSGEESEATWRIIEPVLNAWANGAAPLSEYPAGNERPGVRPG